MRWRQLKAVDGRWVSFVMVIVGALELGIGSIPLIVYPYRYVKSLSGVTIGLEGPAHVIFIALFVLGGGSLALWGWGQLKCGRLLMSGHAPTPTLLLTAKVWPAIPAMLLFYLSVALGREMSERPPGWSVDILVFLAVLITVHVFMATPIRRVAWQRNPSLFQDPEHWFYADPEPLGPFSESEVALRYELEVFGPLTWVWSPQQGAWQTALTRFGFRRYSRWGHV